ncbi:MAG: ATP-dependent Lon protease pim1 [Chaenotheca gracillima]|nr:MAG: ATP-dependent Lon protease pim1 [Chaenotheca gracillima]
MAVAHDPMPPSPPPTFDQSERGEAKRNVWARFRRFSNWLGREDDPCATDRIQDEEHMRREPARRPPQTVVPGLPRPGTFRRQESERRDRLMPHEPGPTERRALSVDRRRAVSSRRSTNPNVPTLPSVSAPEVNAHEEESETEENERTGRLMAAGVSATDHNEKETAPPPNFDNLDEYSDGGPFSDGGNDELLQEDLEKKWILNLSMHFRDRSDREKFFVTYAQSSTCWRRLTISCDYRNAPPDSLEQDLKGLRYQRDKSARVYESIRESLPDIQFYTTVTNLKLQTSEGRLHVHVTEDVNEIIPYPSVASLGHLDIPRYKESMVEFESHLSGFVYKVSVEGNVYIKKEIPGPDSVDEFLYEINALHSVRGAESVIEFGGVIVDNDECLIKGLLISFAEQGALIDILYDEKGRLPWQHRERWAKQIVQGLSEIHEAGFVQGDFTLSNIVVDEADHAKIIDINRRGCPMGWEPPELSGLIESGQRVSMYIGVKSDLFQLGMVLWAVAMEQDEPEMKPRPLSCGDSIPEYFRDIVASCLNPNPQARRSAKELLTLFPDPTEDISPVPVLDALQRRESAPASNPSEKQYIDPSAAVEREDLARFRQLSIPSLQETPPPMVNGEEDGDNQVSSEEATYVNAAPSSRGLDGAAYLPTSKAATYVVSRSGRQSLQHSASNPSQQTTTYNNDRGITTPVTQKPQSSSPISKAPPPTSSVAPLSLAVSPPLVPTSSNTPFTAPGPVPATRENSIDLDLDPQIISISPSHEHRWQEIFVEGHPWLIDRETWGKAVLDNDDGSNANEDISLQDPNEANVAKPILSPLDADPSATGPKISNLDLGVDVGINSHPATGFRGMGDLAGIGGLGGADMDIGRMSAEDEIRLGIGK